MKVTTPADQDLWKNEVSPTEGLEVGCAAGHLDGLAWCGGGQQGAKVGSLGQDQSILSTIEHNHRSSFALFTMSFERFVVEGGSGGGEVVVRMREGVQGRPGTRVLR